MAKHTHVSFFRPPKPGTRVGILSVASGVSPRLDLHKNCLSPCSTKETRCSILKVVGSKRFYSRQLCPKSFTKNKIPSRSDGRAHVSLLPSLAGLPVREWELFADGLCWSKLPAGSGLFDGRSCRYPLPRPQQCCLNTLSQHLLITADEEKVEVALPE